MPMTVLLTIFRSNGSGLHHMLLACGKSFSRKYVDGGKSLASFRAYIFSVTQSIDIPSLSSGKLSLRSYSFGCSSQSDKSNPGGVAKEGYLTLRGEMRFELEVKRSKFIAVAGPVQDERAALAFISEVSDSRATHNCWAYKIGDRYRFNDDGEPGGSAGRPIYAAVEASGLDRVVIVVIRYFGGIKLGTGGLARAYGKVTLDCLSGATTILVKPKNIVTLSMPYDLLGAVYPLLQVYGVEKIHEHYDADGMVVMQLLVDAEMELYFQQSVNNACKGHARFKPFTSS